MTARIRKIDRWFPIDAVNEGCNSSVGSGRSEKAVLTWFASRPIAQARAAVLAALLPDANGETQRLIDIAVRGYDKAAKEGEAKELIEFEDAIRLLADKLGEEYPEGAVLLDPFSGRGMIPLEAGRFGANSIGIDLAQLPCLGGRLLADFPHRDWSDETQLPDAWSPEDAQEPLTDERPRLLRDVEAFLAEVGRRITERCQYIYPRNPDGSFPWGYIWAVTIPCDGCGRRFPLIGSLVLRNPYQSKDDPGQWLRLTTSGDDFDVAVEDGTPEQEATFIAVGGGRKKSGRCLFCGHIHSRDVIKRKGFESQYRDRILAVAENNYGSGPSKLFRALREDELKAVDQVSEVELEQVGDLSPIPDEPIPKGNNDTVRASGYGYETYGSLMCDRQAVQFAVTAEIIRELHRECESLGVSDDYSSALAGYAGATLVRRVMRSTRGTPLLAHGNETGKSRNTVQTNNIYSGESKVADGFDFFESSLGQGPATWDSISSSELSALSKVLDWPEGIATPGRFRASSATSLPLRDDSVDVVVTDPPYYNMIDYSDASDLLYVWARRALYEAMPDLFGDGAPSLQRKDEEIIVKRGGTEDEHRTEDWYHRKLAESFTEMRRVLKPDGHLTVVFGHHDPDAWNRLLGALHDAGFVVTASWPARTESGNTGVASIKVTVAIGCQVAPEDRPEGLMNQVDLEVRREVGARVKQWADEDLALPDQMMAAYGPAMEVYGRYSAVYQPNGDDADLERYLLLARSVVKEATALQLDELPLETFDAPTRLAVFWLRFYGLDTIPKGESRFMAQTEGIRIQDVREELFSEARSGFSLDVSPTDGEIGPSTPTFLLARIVAGRWKATGAEGAARAISEGVRAGVLSQESDAHLWAVISTLASGLGKSHKTAQALAGVQRSKQQIVNLAGRGRRAADEAEAVADAQSQLDV